MRGSERKPGASAGYGCVGAVLGGLVGVAFLIVLSAYFGRRVDQGEDTSWWPLACFLLIFFGWITAGTVAAILVGDRKPNFAHSTSEQKKRYSGLVKDWTIGPILTAAALYIGGIQLGTLPSDWSMIRNFENNRPTLEKLAAVRCPANHNDQAWITLNSVSISMPPNAKPCVYPNCNAEEVSDFSPAEVASVRRSMNSMGFDSMSWNITATELEIDFPVAQEAIPGFMEGIATKGFAYLSTPPAKETNNLDQFNSHTGDSRLMVYRHLKNSWYIYYEYSPQVMI